MASAAFAFWAIVAMAIPQFTYALERTDLIGSWYGEYQYDRFVFARFLAVRRADGTMIVTYRYYKNGAFFSAAKSVGCWEFKDGQYATCYGATNARVETPPKMNRYEVIKYENNEFCYRSTQNDQFHGTTYCVKRVQEGYELP
jgi:hypothetical protein